MTEAALARCPQAGTSARIRIPLARATTSLSPGVPPSFTGPLS